MSDEFIAKENLYPKDQDGLEYYERDGAGNEVYKIQSGHQVTLRTKDRSRLYARTKDEDQMYPKDKHSNEYYAPYGDPNPEWAANRDGHLKYARDASNRVILPTDRHGNEYYIKLWELGDGLHRYARAKSGRELYPTTKRGEVILNKIYAKDEHSKPYYPLDADGNEYTLSLTLVNALVAGYPITHSNDIILPAENGGKAHVILNEADVDEKDIIGKLYRKTNGFFLDHVTSKKSKRQSRSAGPCSFVIMDAEGNIKIIRKPLGWKWWFLVILIALCLTVGIFYSCLCSSPPVHETMPTFKPFQE